MPQGKGTYGSKVGRPPKNKKKRDNSAAKRRHTLATHMLDYDGNLKRIRSDEAAAPIPMDLSMTATSKSGKKGHKSLQEIVPKAKPNKKKTGPSGKMNGGKMKNKPLAMKEGGRPMSEMLEDKRFERLEAKFKSSEKKNRDRGSSGRATEAEETIKALDEAVKDRKLLDKYGKDAPKSRAFMTERPKKMSMGG